jgi:c-di-AMP phosphodiesterase-like protein
MNIIMCSNNHFRCIIDNTIYILFILSLMLTFLIISSNNSKFNSIVILIYTLLIIFVIIRIYEFGIPENLKICFRNCIFGDLENQNENENY